MKHKFTFTELVLNRLRDLVSGNRREVMSWEEFRQITRMRFDNEMFRYYLVDPGDEKKRIFEINADLVFEAINDGRLRELMGEIIKAVEWAHPWYYNLGLFPPYRRRNEQ